MRGGNEVVQRHQRARFRRVLAEYVKRRARQLHTSPPAAMLVAASTGGPTALPAFLAPIAGRVRAEAGLPVAAAWGIDDPQIADGTVSRGQLDLVMVGRAHLANPHWPMQAARALKIDRPTWVLPAPYAHWLERYGTR